MNDQELERLKAERNAGWAAWVKAAKAWAEAAVKAAKAKAQAEAAWAKAKEKQP